MTYMLCVEVLLRSLLEVIDEVGDVVVTARAALTLLSVVLRGNLLQVGEVVRPKLVDDAGKKVLELCTQKRQKRKREREV